MVWLLLVLLAMCAAKGTCPIGGRVPSEAFSESATFIPISDSLLLAHLQFTINGTAAQHSVLLPPLLRDTAVRYPIKNLHLSFTKGFWRAAWGRCPLEEAPSGVHLRATFPTALLAHPTAAAALWGNLSVALSGPFCAALGQLSSPSRWVVAQHTQHIQELQGWLPAEAICTENLVAWLQLLPCRDAAGLARLLKQRSMLYGAVYHSMRLALTRTRHNTLMLTQSLTVVLQQPYRSRDTASNQLRTWIASADLHTTPCPWAVASTVHIHPSTEHTPLHNTTCNSSDTQAIMHAIQGLHPTGTSHSNAHNAPRAHDTSLAHSAPVAVEQYVLGRGDVYGRLVLGVSFSPHMLPAHTALHGADCPPATLHILQALPWVLRPWLHALEATLVAGNGSSHASCHADGSCDANATFRAWSFRGPLDCGSWVQPTRGPHRPSAVSLCVVLAPGVQHVRVVLPFSKGFMHVDQHPPDSERGVDIPSARATVTTRTVQDDEVCEVVESYTAWSRGVLVFLATPDFSMAYNVTCITSTAVALFAGILFNTLIRRPAAQQTKEQRRRRRMVAVAVVVVIAGVALLQHQ